VEQWKKSLFYLERRLAQSVEQKKKRNRKFFLFGTEIQTQKKELRHKFVLFLSNDMSESVPESVPAPSKTLSSFASRNPTRDVNPVRVRQHPKITDAEKITAEAKRQLNKENAAALQLEVEQAFDARNTEVSRIAKKHNKTDLYIRQILAKETNFRGTRAPSLRNALVHAKGVEMNEGKEVL